MAVLQAQSVSKFFRRGSKAEVRALQDISLEIAEGSFAVLTGPSGSGKTTLLALLGALERPTSGHVLFQGRALDGCSDVELARVRRRMGFIFQDFALIAGLPIWENITYPLIPRGFARPARYELAQTLLSRLGMPEKLTARPRELSGGEQQRVAVARALAGQPAVLLADEPTSQLDPAAAGQLRTLFREVHAAGATVVMSSHDPQLVALATLVVELEAGRLKRVCP
jgi:putative ABC transport system ATP-binding protein